VVVVGWLFGVVLAAYFWVGRWFFFSEFFVGCSCYCWGLGRGFRVSLGSEVILRIFFVELLVVAFISERYFFNVEVWCGWCF